MALAHAAGGRDRRHARRSAPWRSSTSGARRRRASRTRTWSTSTLGARRDRGLLPRLHPRLDPDARRVGHPDRLPRRAAGGDGLDAREVRAGRRLDARGAHGGAAAHGRRDRDGDGARVDPARGDPLGDLGRDRARRQPRLGARRRRAARAADRLRDALLVPAPPARLPLARAAPPEAVRRRRDRAAAVSDDAAAALLLLRHVGDRRRRPVLPAALGRQRPGPRDAFRSWAGSPRSARSWRCSPSSCRRGSARARRRCTGCCSR